MRRLFANPLGACAPPQAPNKKYIFGVFGSLISAIGNQNTTDATNFSNEYQTRITNKYNQAINEAQLAAQRENWKREQENFELQRKWALEDRDYENRYNLPINVRDRLLQAGINPAFAMQSGQQFGVAGSSTKMGSAPSFSAPASAIPMQAAHSIPVDYSGLGLGFSKIDDYIMQKDALSQDFTLRKREQDIVALDTLSKIVQRGFENSKFKAEADRIMQDLRWNDETWKGRQDAINYANDLIKANQAEIEARTDAQKFANSIAPDVHDMNRQLFAQELEKGQAMIADLYSRKDLTDTEKDLVSKKIAEQVIRNSRLPKTLHNENAIQVATYNQIKKAGLKLDQETKNLEWIEKDLRKGYRSHSGSDRSLQDIIEVELKRNKNGARMPSMQ